MSTFLIITSFIAAVVFLIWLFLIEIPLIKLSHRHVPEAGDIYKSKEYAYEDEYDYIKILDIIGDIVEVIKIRIGEEELYEFGKRYPITLFTLEEDYIWKP